MSHSISFYIETNYSTCLFISECYCLSQYMQPYLNTCNIYLNTLTRLTAPYLFTCIANLNTLSRFSAPYLNTCITYLNSLSRLYILIHCRLVSSRQPIRVEHYVTRVVSQSESSITSPELSITSPEGSRFGWRSLLGSRLESPPRCSDQLTLSLLTCRTASAPPQAREVRRLKNYHKVLDNLV